MRKLDEIPKKNIYEVPDGYFDRLPSVIQARVTGKEKAGHPFFYYTVRYALPVLVLAAALIFWLGNNRPHTPQSAEEMLAAVNTESLVAYLEDTEQLTTDLVLDAVDLTPEDIDNIEREVYDLGIEDEDLDALLDEYDYELIN